MNKNKVSIIYGDNGEGKSLYYRNIIQKNESKYLPFNYDIEKWYNHKYKTFSEFNLRGKEITNTILNLNKEFLENIKNELDLDIQSKIINEIITNINTKNNLGGKANKYIKSNKDILKVINFVNHLNDIKLKTNSIISETFSCTLEEMKSYLETYNGNQKYKDIFSELYGVDTAFENICVYINLHQYKDVDFLKENENNKIILEIKKRLENYLNKHIDNIKELDNEKNKKEILEIIQKSDIDILNKIYRSDDKWKNEEKIQLLIINKIFDSNTFNNWLSKIKKYDEIKKSCIKFNIGNFGIKTHSLSAILQNKINKIKNEIKISSDGIFIEKIDLGDERVSNGEKIILIFSLFLSYFFNEKKIIVFDDVFEKLDFSNTSSLIRAIFDELMLNDTDNIKSIEILTHDVHLINLFNDIYNEYDTNNFLIYYPYIQINNEHSIELKGQNSKNFIFNFDILLKNIKNSFSGDSKHKEQYKNNHVFASFCKFFHRNGIGNNWIQSFSENKNTMIQDSYSLKIYQFISENIFHYSPKIVLDDDIKEFFCELNPESECYKNEKDKILDTVQIYQNFITEIKNEKSKYGIDLTKLKEDIDKMKKFIELEKKFYESNIENYDLRKSANDYYKSHWNSVEMIEAKSKRNSLFHSFKNSLTKYRIKNKKGELNE